LHQTGGINEVSLGGSIRTVRGTSASMLIMSRNVMIAKPKNAIRTDTTNVADHRMTFAVPNGMARVVVGASGPITGSATLISQSTGNMISLPCGASKTESVTSWNAT
jgi:hypothetical protein